MRGQLPPTPSAPQHPRCLQEKRTPRKNRACSRAPPARKVPRPWRRILNRSTARAGRGPRRPRGPKLMALPFGEVYPDIYQQNPLPLHV